jgi:hypothetical protein
MKTSTTKLLLLALITMGACKKDEFYQKTSNIESLTPEPIVMVTDMDPPSNPPPGNPPPPSNPPAPENPPVIPVDICLMNPMAAACINNPAVNVPHVVMILLTLSQINPSAAQLIAVNIVKQVSPVANPKILLAKDSNIHGEDPQDVTYVRDLLLLSGFDVEYFEIPAGGLQSNKLVGKDVVWVINPGYPLQDNLTRNTLINAAIPVVLQGDDMAQGNQALTGVNIVDNGTSINCQGNNYYFDNLAGLNYQVNMASNFLPGIAANLTSSAYGNDIDHVANPSSSSNVKVLAWAVTPSELPAQCQRMSPAITSRPKPVQQQ